MIPLKEQKDNNANNAKNKKILITGGFGFIGSHLVDHLMNLDHFITVIDDNSTGSLENIRKWIGNSKFKYFTRNVIESLPNEWIHNDNLNNLNDDNNANDKDGRSFSNPFNFDEIYHLACAASPIHYQDDPIKTIKTCTIGTLNMLELARVKNAKFLLASTSEVYGDPKEHPQSESYFGNVNIFGPRACYDEGKRAAESMVYAYKTKYPEMQVRIARIFNTFGPRMSEKDGRVVCNFISQALNGIPMTIYGDGLQTRSFQYVDDLIGGLMKLMESNLNEPINLGNPDEYTINDFAILVKDLIQSNSPIIYQAALKDDPRMRRPDISKAKKLLNWQPQISLRDGLEKTIEYFNFIK